MRDWQHMEDWQKVDPVLWAEELTDWIDADAIEIMQYAAWRGMLHLIALRNDVNVGELIGISEQIHFYRNASGGHPWILPWAAAQSSTAPEEPEAE